MFAVHLSSDSSQKNETFGSSPRSTSIPESATAVPVTLLLRRTMLSSTVNVAVFKYVVLPETVRFPSTTKSPDTVTLSGNPIVTFPTDADTVISLLVPATLRTPVLAIVKAAPSPLPVILIPSPADADAT